MTPIIFRKKVLNYYRKHRRDFPWRPPSPAVTSFGGQGPLKTQRRASLKLRRGKADPYRILVSEIMLQQTQTHRVVPKYEAFLKAFPTIETLAKAPLSAVLKLWQGLGYNRRAMYLQRAAQAAVRSHSGQLPDTYDELRVLSGVGPYTASAVLAFAFNKPVRQAQGEPVAMIETNIRAAVIHEFFSSSRRSLSEGGRSAKKKISDAELLPILTKALPRENPRDWYYALMDYGAFIKQKYPNPSRRSAHHAKQSKFEGSDRQIRGHIIRELTKWGKVRVKDAGRFFGHTSRPSMGEARPVGRQNDKRVGRILNSLIREGLVSRNGNHIRISS